MPATADDARAAKDDVREFYARTLPVTAVGVTRTARGFAVVIDVAADPGTPLPSAFWPVPVVVRFVTGDTTFL